MKIELKSRIREELLLRDGVHHGDTGIVAVSGGADSVFLLRMLNFLAEELNLRLIVVHVHHGIRGEEADRDAAFTEGLAEEMHLPFRLARVDAPGLAEERSISLEEAARILRYQELRRVREEEKASWIALAHHRDDLVETVLFHLLRGTGPRGLRGILPRQEDCIRPLLSLYRAEIVEWMEEQGYTWCEDSTNQDLHHARNRIRHRILPEMLAVNSGAKEHILRLAEDAAARYDLIAAEAEKLRGELIQRRDGTVLIPDRLLAEASSEEVREELLLDQLAEMSGFRKDLTEKHLMNVLELREKESGKKMALPYGLAAMRTAEGILLYRREDPFVPVSEEEKERTEGTISIERRKYIPGDSIPGDEYHVMVDADRIRGEITLRTPREDDRIMVGKDGESKKLNRFFTDRKLPDIYRNRWPVAADEEGVFWVVGLRLDMRCRVTEETREVLILRWKGELPTDR